MIAQIINALQAVGWMIGAAAISYPVADVVLRQGPRHRGGNS